MLVCDQTLLLVSHIHLYGHSSDSFLDSFQTTLARRFLENENEILFGTVSMSRGYRPMSRVLSRAYSSLRCFHLVIFLIVQKAKVISENPEFLQKIEPYSFIILLKLKIYKFKTFLPYLSTMSTKSRPPHGGEFKAFTRTPRSSPDSPTVRQISQPIPHHRQPFPTHPTSLPRMPQLLPGCPIGSTT